MELLLQLRANTPKEYKRFIKFLIVGAFGFAVDFGTFNLVHTLFGLSEVASQTISFCLAVMSNFVWNYFWIYPEARGSKPMLKIIQFVVVSMVGLAVGIPVFSVALVVANNVVSSLGLDKLPLNLAGNMALITRVLVLLLWNFFVNRFWTYGEVK